MSRLFRRLNKEDFLLFAAWLFIVGLTVFQRLIAGVTNLNEWSLREILKFPLTSLVVGFILIIFWIKPGFKMITRIISNWKYFLFICHGLIYGCVYIISVALVYGFLLENVDITFSLQMAKQYFTEGFHEVLKNYVFLTAMLFALNYFKTREQTLRTKNKIEQDFITFRLNTLKEKLQPHFLFNTLNSVVSLIDEDKKKAQKSLIHLSDLLRYSIDLKPKNLVPIHEEIELSKKYLSIEKARYEKQIEIIWSNIESTQDFNVPAMILQPILENSIKHGFKGFKGVLILDINVDEKSKMIQIKNNGAPLSENRTKGIGLSIVRQQLQYHFPDNHTFRLFEENGWVIYELLFP